MAKGLYEKNLGRVIYAGKNITGRRYGHIKVLCEIQPLYTNSGRRLRRVHCLCDCGREFDHTLSPIVGGRVKSCGHVFDRHDGHHVKHNATGDNLYKTWKRIKYEVTNGLYKDDNLGMDPDWLIDDEDGTGYQNFRDWAEKNGYTSTEKCRIVRIDYAKGYSPENCLVLNVHNRKDLLHGKGTREERLLAYWRALNRISKKEDHRQSL